MSPQGALPSVRNDLPISYDPNSNRLIIFGGINQFSEHVTYDDSWVLTNANGVSGTPEWFKLKPTGPLPTGRRDYSSAYDARTTRLIMGFGEYDVMGQNGLATSSTIFNDTWVLSNASGQCTANQPCNYDVEATDPDPGDTLTYSLVNGPSGMSIDSVTGLLQWIPTPNQIGDHAVTVQVQDSQGLSANQSFTLTVAPVAVPNVVGLAPEWGEALLQAAGLNAGTKNSLGGAITLNFDTLPSQQGWEYWALGNSAPEKDVFSTSGGTLLQNSIGVGFAGQGSNRYRFKNVVDKRLPFALSTQARVLQDEGDTTRNSCGFGVGLFTSKEAFGICLGPTRIQDQRMTFLSTTVNNTVFHNFRLEGIPGKGYSLLVDDVLLATGPTVLVTFDNGIDLGDGTGGTNAKAEVSAYSFTQPRVAAQDPPAGTLVPNNSNVDLAIQDGPATQTVPNVVGQPQADAAAAITAAQLTVGAITFEVSDTVPSGSVIRQQPVAGTKIMKDFKVDLVVSSAPVNHPPTITSIAPTTATAGQPYTYAVQASDPDTGDTLTYALTTAPTGMTLAPTTGLIQWTPTGAQKGANAVTVQVTDSGGLTATQSFTVTVAIPADNHPPSITSIPPLRATAGLPYTYAVVASDPDTWDVLSYRLAPAPAGMTLDPVTHVIQWTPTADQVGSQPYTLTVEDSGGLGVSQIVTVAVAASVTVPNLVGLTQADAQAQLTAAQLNRGTVTTADSDTVPPGRVISQNPATGTIVVRASAVDLVISLGPAQVTVPNVVGQTQAAADAALTAALLSIGTITHVNDNTVPAGQVVSQNPTAGTVVARDSAVNLTLSLGPADITVPNVVGLEQAAAQAALLAAQLSVGTITPAASDTVPAGHVISQNPPAGSSVVKGFAVALTVSTGPAPAIVPDVVGQPQAVAQAALLAANLITGTITTAYHDTVPAGRVSGQNPAAGAELPKGSPVDLVISLGPAPVSVPDLVGQPQAAATALLTAAHLTVGTITSEYSATVPAGRVIRHDPAAGASVLPGTAVNLVLSSGPPPIPLKAIRIQPGPPQLLTGQTQTFTAIGILNDGTSQTLTAGQVTWSSSNPTVATVNANGTTTALSAGTTTPTSATRPQFCPLYSIFST